MKGAPAHEVEVGLSGCGRRELAFCSSSIALGLLTPHKPQAPLASPRQTLPRLHEQVLKVIHNSLKKTARPFLLLEVVIAFALIVLCVIPLLYPHFFIVKSQRAFLQRVELDHLTNLVYIDILEQLYLNKIPWDRIANKEPIPIDLENITGRFRDVKTFTWKGTYSFNIANFKPKEENGSPDQKDLHVYLLDLTIQFNSTEEDRNLSYQYLIAMKRILAEQEEQNRK